MGASRALHLVLRITFAVATVAAVTAVLVAAEADLAFAAIVLLLVVVGSAVLGFAPGLVAAVLAAGALTYWFTPPYHSFAINQADDVLALVAFISVSAAVAAAVARLNRLRRQAELGAREARLRLAFTNSLAAGRPVPAVLQELADGLVELFDLAACSVTVGEARGEAARDIVGIDTVAVSSPPVALELELLHPFWGGERDTIDALAVALATALDRARFDAEAREQQLRADVVRSRAAFLATVTHDLRTPLATIKTATGALLMPDDALTNADRRELATDAHHEVDRLIRLVDKTLELSRIRAGAVVTDTVELAPADLVRLATERLHGSADVSRVRLDIDPDVPAVVVDPLLAEHALRNLIENALLHDPSGGEVLVSARATTGSDAPTVELLVVDHGPGIAPEQQERVFEEFVRLGAPTDGTGTGLGLAVARGLVEVHSGTVTCTTTPGGGATFVVTLPATGVSRHREQESA
ncbi:MAG: ATP-binding protein [Acidimicrobiia bacterium]